MTTTMFKKVLGYSVAALMVAPVLINCGAISKIPGADALGGKCPDITKVDDVASFDFAGNFGISADGAAKLKSGVISSIELKAFADQIDTDLKTGCGGLAKDLGATGDFATGQDACNAAITALGTAKAKLGAQATLALDIKPPACEADLNVYASCAGKCDAKLSGGQAKVECEPGKLAGSCGGSCSGTCDFKAGGTCSGTCAGTCDAKMKGSCGGKCDGKCDGKSSKGASCNGTCEGKCDDKISGTCKGQCGGSCQMTAAATCDGTCTGSCSVDFKEPKCTGKVTPPTMSADCKTRCDSEVSAKMVCTPASVALSIKGAADATAATAYKAAIEKNFPLILKVAIGMADQAGAVAAEGQATIEGVQGSIKEIASSSGGAKGAITAGKITGCFAEPFKGAIDAAASVQANVKVSVDVKASASASGSAGGSAGGAAPTH